MRGVVLRGLAATSVLVIASCADLWGFDDPSGPDAAADDAATDRQETVGPARVVDATADGFTVPTAVDARLDDARRDVGINQSRGDAVSTPTCTPVCTFGGTCTSAVGGADVCVSSFSCTDSSECIGSGCCVWTDATSATGRCESTAVGATSTASCLCTKQGTGMDMNTCKKCSAPASDPTAPVTVCQS